MNVLSGLTIEELLAMRSRLLDAWENGSQTRVQLGPGISDEFTPLTDKQVEEKLRQINEALNALDPDTYPLKSKRMKITTVHGW